nr:hypothetical protein [Methylomarinum sp. Ch1-1]MDP4519552.1 hypothetical protein [Methylomarinum sp. Ch1-1]
MLLKDNKMTAIGLAVAAGIFILGGYFYVSQEGVQRFEDFLYDHELDEAIRYRDISYSPLFDAISLENVDLDVEVMKGVGVNLTGNMDTLVFSGGRDDDGLEISFSNYKLITDPTQKEQQQNIIYALSAEPLKMVRQMGIKETALDGRLSYQYDNDDDRLNLGLMLDAENIAGLSTNLEFERARKLINLKLSDLTANNIMNLQNLMEEFGRVEFSLMEAEIVDHGFLEKMAYMNALSAFRYDRAINHNMEIDAVKYVQSDKGDKGKALWEGVDEDSGDVLKSFITMGVIWIFQSIQNVRSD